MKFGKRAIGVVFILSVLFGGACDLIGRSCQEKLQKQYLGLIKLDHEETYSIDDLAKSRGKLGKLLASCDIPEAGLEIPVFGQLSILELAVLANDIERIASILRLRAKGKQQVQRLALVDGTTPLHLAAHFGTTESIELLLKNGFGVDVKDDFGNTPLMASIGGLQIESANMDALVSAGANINAMTERGMTALTMAVGEEDPLAVKYLIAKGASLRPHGPDDTSIIELAQRVGDDRILSILKEAN